MAPRCVSLFVFGCSFGTTATAAAQLVSGAGEAGCLSPTAAAEPPPRTTRRFVNGSKYVFAAGTGGGAGVGSSPELSSLDVSESEPVPASLNTAVLALSAHAGVGVVSTRRLAWSLAGWGGATEPDEACFFSSFLALALRFFSRRFARTASTSPSRPSLVAALTADWDSSVVSAVEHGGLVKTRIGICGACWERMRYRMLLERENNWDPHVPTSGPKENSFIPPRFPEACLPGQSSRLQALHVRLRRSLHMEFVPVSSYHV